MQEPTSAPKNKTEEELSFEKIEQQLQDLAVQYGNLYNQAFADKTNEDDQEDVAARKEAEANFYEIENSLIASLNGAIDSYPKSGELFLDALKTQLNNEVYTEFLQQIYLKSRTQLTMARSQLSEAPRFSIAGSIQDKTNEAIPKMS